MVEDWTLQGIEVFWLKTLGIHIVCEIRNSDFLNVVGVHSRQWFQFELNVFSPVNSLQSGHLLDELVVFEGQKVDSIKFILVVLTKPFIQLLLWFFYFLFGFLLGGLHFEIFYALGQFGVMYNALDFFSESYQILNCKILPRYNNVELVIKVLTGPVLTLFYLLKKIKHQQFPELGRMLDQDISKFLQEGIYIVEMFLALFFLLGLCFAVKSKVHEVGSEIEFCDWFVVFEKGVVFSEWLLRNFPLLFFSHVDFFRMEQLL